MDYTIIKLKKQIEQYNEDSTYQSYLEDVVKATELCLKALDALHVCVGSDHTPNAFTDCIAGMDDAFYSDLVDIVLAQKKIYAMHMLFKKIKKSDEEKRG